MIVVPAPDPQAPPFAILDAGSGALVTALEGPDWPMWGRTPDVVAYLILDERGVENLWERRIAGGPARQLTAFTSGRTFSFAYSADGRRLFLSRGTRTGDVTLIRGFQ